jgi:uncharacterized protein DUF397
MTWQKSTRSGADGCVEVNLGLEEVPAHGPGREVSVQFADDGVWLSQPNTPSVRLWFDRHEWDAFVMGAKNGEFDLEDAS